MEFSLKKRFSAKLASNIISTGASLVIMSIVPRALGPGSYGNFSFLVNIFNKIMGFLGFGTPMGFYTKLSQRPKEQKLIRFYIIFLLIVLLSSLLLLFIIYITGNQKIFFPDQEWKYIFLALTYAYLLFIIQIVRQVNDAYGFTVASEKIFIFQKLLSLVFVLVLFMVGLLNLFSYFITLIFVFTFLLLLWVLNLHRNGIKPFNVQNNVSIKEIKNYISEFASYSHPLFVLSIITLLASVGERWILQFFSGAEQQGFYSLSYGVTTVIFLFTGAMAPLFTRDFSIAWKAQDFNKMRNLFNRLVPPLVALAAYFSLFVAANGEKIGVVFGGTAYQNAGKSITIMALYPIHQTYGQLCGSVFFASGKTKLYRNLSIPINVLGLLFSFFLIAPEKFGGLNLGSLGLSYKMVLVQIVGVNIVLYYSMKILSLPYKQALLFQLKIISVFAILAFGIRFLSDSWSLPILLQLLISGLLYSVCSALFIYLFPGLVSSSKKEILENLKRIKTFRLNK